LSLEINYQTTQTLMESSSSSNYMDQ